MQNEKARKAVIDAMNEGTVRVIFGSTSMLGTGVNAQNVLWQYITSTPRGGLPTLHSATGVLCAKGMRLPNCMLIIRWT